MPVNTIIIAITCIVSILAFSNRELSRKLIFNAYLVNHRREWHRMFTSGLLHADYTHLFMNMLVLFIFGREVEQHFEMFEYGDFFYISMYILAIPIANTKSLLQNRDNPGYNALGASGATSAVLFAFILFQPLRTLYILGFFPAPAVILGIGYLWYSSKMAKKNVDNIGHDAHFYGAIFGLVYTLLLNPQIGLDFIDIINNFIQKSFL
jgi:membrane associated rhomboid family serine protease